MAGGGQGRRQNPLPEGEGTNVDGQGIIEDEGREKATEVERGAGRQSKARASGSPDSGPPGQGRGGEHLGRGGAERLRKIKAFRLRKEGKV